MDPSPQRDGHADAAAGPRAGATESLDFRAVFEAAPDLYLLLRADAPHFTIVGVSDEYLRATLTTREGPASILGRGLFEVFPDPPDEPDATGTRNLRASLERAIASKAPDPMAIQPYAIRRPDGSWEERSWSPLNSPMVDAATGQVTLLIHRVVDVTDAVRLAADHARLRTEHSDLEAFSRALEDANAQLQEQQLELEMANQQLQDQATELELQAEELEERARAAERAEAALVESEQLLQTLADAIPTLAWTARPDGYVDWYNARWYEYTGTTPEQMAGWGWRSVIDDEVLPGVMARWGASIESGEPFEMTFPVRAADGHSRRFLTRATPLTDATGHVVRWFGTNTDVEAERAAREEAEHANQAKTDFLATMSHELRTPLNAIAGYAELLEIGVHGAVTEAQHEAIVRIRRSQRQLLGLINDVLNFAKLEAGHVEYRVSDVDVCDVVDDLVPLVSPQLAAKSLGFDRDQCAPGCVVRADREKVRQVLLNLVSNAIKFTAKGGTIVLGCDVRDDFVSAWVGDTGIGIAEEDQTRVFAPFVQIDRRLNAPGEGTGLGLAISRDLARGMGGDLTVESAPGDGSTFTLTLPRSATVAPVTTP